MNKMLVKHRTTPGTWALFRWFDIPSKENPDLVYLRRLRLIQTPWFGIYVHWINEPDTDRHPHDHPWNFWSLIIRGGYTEAVYDGIPLAPIPVKQTWTRWSWHRMSIDRAHSITSVQPGLITLVFCGRRVRTWCFWTDDGLIPWQKYVDDGDAS